jgi:hypothetical protein
MLEVILSSLIWGEITFSITALLLNIQASIPGSKDIWQLQILKETQMEFY